MHFKLLSDKFDKESMIGPAKANRVKTIYKRFDTDIQKLDKLGIDKSKKEIIEMELSDLLHTT